MPSPSRPTARAGRTGPARPDDARRRRLVALGPRRRGIRGGRDRLRLRARRCRAGPARPAQRVAAARVSTDPSRTFDASSFDWTDDGWRGPRSGAGVLGAVVYELHLGTFTPEGTLDAAVARLDHLVALGVDVVQLMPVAAFPGRWGWGYDGVDLWAVHDGYGGPVALQRFVDACHARGLGVALDVVHNHLGASGNYLSRFGPYFTEGHHTPWGPAVNLDHAGSPEVRRFLVESVLRWFRDFHVDALRLDAVHELKDDSQPHYLAELSDTVATLSTVLGRPLDLVAESDLNDTSMVTPDGRGRPGDDGPVGRRRAPRPARGAHRRGARLLRRLRRRRCARRGGAARGARQGAHPRVPPRRHDVDLPRPAVGQPGRRRAPRRATAPGLPADPRPGRQPDDGRPRLGRGRRRACRRPGPRSTCWRRRPRWSSWGRSGRPRRPGSSSRASTTTCWPMPCAAGGGPSSVPTGGRRTPCPTRRTPRPATPRCSTGPRATSPSTRGCCAGTPTASPCAASCSATHPPGSPTSRSRSTTTPAGWSMTHAPAGRAGIRRGRQPVGRTRGTCRWPAARPRCSSPGTSPAPRWSASAVRVPAGSAAVVRLT